MVFLLPLPTTPNTYLPRRTAKTTQNATHGSFGWDIYLYKRRQTALKARSRRTRDAPASSQLSMQNNGPHSEGLVRTTRRKTSSLRTLARKTTIKKRPKIHASRRPLSVRTLNMGRTKHLRLVCMYIYMCMGPMKHQQNRPPACNSTSTSTTVYRQAPPSLNKRVKKGNSNHSIAHHTETLFFIVCSISLHLTTLRGGGHFATKYLRQRIAQLVRA